MLLPKYFAGIEGDVVEKEVKSYSQRGLARLLARAQQGQPEAREDIFFFLRARFLALAKHRLVREDAEDVVQETLIVVHDHFSEFKTVEGLLAFTNEVMRNKIGNFYRKRDRQKRYHITWGAVPELVYYLEGELDAAELDRILRKAIDQLGEKSPICRAILLGLREGLSAGELSRWLRLSRSQIDDRVFRCRRALRRLLLKDYGLQV